ncbi:hypothetical protein AUP68_14773 [Ilyonectria robusta]
MVHLLVLGGNGRTGQYGIQYALEKGHTVTAIVRKSSSLQPQKGLNIVTGSVSNPEDVDRAISAAPPIDGVAVFLNASRTSDMPWAKLVVPPRFITDAVANVANSIHKTAPITNTRLVVMSAIGVGDSWEVAPWFLRVMISKTNLGTTYTDHNCLDGEIASIAGKGIVWTLVRAVGLSSSGRKQVKVFGSNKPGAGYTITRESCANWMIDAADGTLGSEYDNKAVIVSN